MDVGTLAGASLNTAAYDALHLGHRLAGGPNGGGASQFTFQGRTYLAINMDTNFNSFDDAGDLLIDITGATGTITLSNFS